MANIPAKYEHFFRTILFIITFFAVTAAPVFSKVITIDETLTIQPIGLHTEYLEDKDGTLTLEDIQSEKLKGNWIASKVENPGFGITDSVYWVRFAVENTAGRDIQFYFEQNFPQTDLIRLYVPENAAYRTIETGDSRPFPDRPVEHRSFVFPLTLKAGTSATYYVMIRSAIMNIIFRVMSPRYFLKFSSGEYHLIMLFYGIVLIMLVYNLVLFFFIRRIEYLYYAVFVFFLLLFMMGMDGTAYQFIWPDSPWWTTFCMPLLINLFMIFIILFCLELVDLRRLKNKAWYLHVSYNLAFLFIILYILNIVLSPFIPHYIDGSIAVALAVLSLSYIGTTGIIMIIKEKSRPALLGMIAASAVILGGMAYSLKNFGILPINFITEWSMHAGITIMLVLFSITLADRINIMRKDLAVLNNNLEEKVIERTDELETAMEELEAMNEELKATNDQLLETNIELEDAHRIAQQDMKMAANVQSTLFPKEPPGLSGWDIAFVFRPMAGVSGDFYDFYTEKDTLEGIALFDVSGHGIASALITMIARSVLFRNFKKSEDADLGRMLEQSNRELIGEIGRTDKYLTGLILRFRTDTVEYVNAAHSDLLCKKHGSGDVRVIRPDGIDYRGMFMGVDGLDKSYTTVKFQVETNDMLLLYTDCLDESRNSQHEEYGIERIKESIKKAPGASAKQVLDSILDDFYKFIGGHQINDDLTVVVLKKKGPDNPA